MYLTEHKYMQDGVLVFVIDMDHVSGEWEWEIPAGEAETVDDFGLWIFFGLVSGKTQSLANLLSIWQALKLPSQKGPMNETFPIFLEGFQLFEVSW